MNAAHWHLILNHAPVMGVLIGILLLAGGITTKSGAIINASLLVMVFAALLTIPVYYTGEPAEEIVENLGVSHEVIHEHEEAAEWGGRGVAVLALLALTTLYLKHKQNRKAGLFAVITLFVGLFVTVILYRVGYLGGMIRHTEISSPAVDITPENSLNPKEEDD